MNAAESRRGAIILRRPTVIHSFTMVLFATVISVLCSPNAFGQIDRPTLDQIEDPTVRAIVVRGMTARQTGQSNEALQFLESALQMRPNDAVVMSLLARIRADTGDLEGAAYLAREAFARSGNPRDALQLSEFLVRQGRLGEALAALDAALLDHPTYTSLLVERAEVRRDSGDREGAEKDVEAATTLALGDGQPPAGIRDLDTIVSVAESIGSPAGLEAARKRVSMDPGSVAARVSLASLLIAIGDTASARQTLDQIPNLDPMDSAAGTLRSQLAVRAESTNFDGDNETVRSLLSKFPIDRPRLLAAAAGLIERAENGSAAPAETDLAAHVLLRTNRAADALALLEPLLERDVSSPERFGMTVEAQRRAGTLTAARIACSDGQLFFQDNIRLLAECMQLSLHEVDEAGARDLLLRVRRAADISPPLEPVDARVEVLAAETMAWLHDDVSAQTSIQLALAINGLDPFVQIHAASAYLKLGDRERADNLMTKALATADPDDDVLRTAGRIRMALGQFKSAEELLSRATTQTPDSSIAFELLGDATLGATAPVEARKAYERALELDPTNPTLKSKVDGLPN